MLRTLADVPIMTETNVRRLLLMAAYFQMRKQMYELIGATTPRLVVVDTIRTKPLAARNRWQYRISCTHGLALLVTLPAVMEVNMQRKQ